MIRWYAVAEVEPDPLRIVFGNVKPGTRHNRPVSLRVRSSRAKVTSWECIPAHRLTAHPVGDAAAVTVQLDAGDEIGSFAGTLIGTIDGAWPTVLRIPIEWSVRQSVEALPPRLFLGHVPPGQRITRSLVVSSPTGEQFGISAVACRGIDGLEAQVRDGQGNGTWIEVMWTAPAARGPLSGTIEIALGGTDSDALRVPVSGFVAESADAAAVRMTN
jgi:hypothetical protein